MRYLHFREMARHLTLIAAGALIVASAAYWISVRAGRAVSTQSNAQGKVTLVDDLDPVYLSVAPVQDDAIAPGHFVFGLEPGEQLSGIGVATVFPEAANQVRPALGLWMDVTGVQVPKGLDLRRWIKERGPTNVHYMNFGLWVECAGSMELRTGWARFDPTQLAAGSVIVQCPKRESVTFDVRTALGQPVPGALVTIDRGMFLEPGLISYLGYTGADGSLRVSGLEPGRDWIVRLPDGVGPMRTPLMSTFNTPATDPVVLQVEGMKGEWTFVRHQMRFPISGCSTRIQSAECPCHEMPEAWPVNNWIGPGRGPLTPFYVALRETRMTDARPLPLVLRFQQGEPVKLEDAKVSSRITAVAMKSPPARD